MAPPYENKVLKCWPNGEFLRNGEIERFPDESEFYVEGISDGIHMTSLAFDRSKKYSSAINPLPPNDAVQKQKKNIWAFQFSNVRIQKISPPWKPEI